MSSVAMGAPSRSLHCGFHAPARGGHRGLEAQTADDLLEDAVRAVFGRKLRNHLDTNRAPDVGAVEAMQTDAAGGKPLQQQRTYVRLRVAPADDVHHVAARGFR